MRIKYLGDTKGGPEGMDIPYAEGSQLWHIVVDFACMPNKEFTIGESYVYHELDTAWNQNSSATTYYNESMLNQLVKDGFIEVLS